MKRNFAAISCAMLPVFCCSVIANAAAADARGPKDYFAIEVVDAATGRGVPLVELKTTNDIRYVTDSNGLVAFDEPGLLGGKVFFEIMSPGYEPPVDGFGIKGVALVTTPGKSAKIELKRVNIAERLYRITGQGIYADTVRLGRKPPTAEPLMTGRVVGQDSVQRAVYRDKIHWFWGDTSKPEYPLGNFGTSGATSALPGKGDGLDPDRGINLHYFTSEEGFSRKMVPIPRPGPIWIEGVTVVPDTARDRKRMIGSYVRVKTLDEALERGIIAYDDTSDTFVPVRELDKNARLLPRGHALNVKTDGVDYVYFACPYPIVRVAAHWDHVIDQKAYEAFTCLKPGGRYDKDNPPLDRDADGKLVYAWKRNTDPIGPGEQAELVKAGKLKPDEGWLQLKDIDTKEPVTAHAGSVAWNDFRKRYVMVFTQTWGKESLLGEIWYAEADAPEGPWRFARQVATHPKQSLYNACHHPFLDQKGGRLIYFEGTYTADFSGTVKTPRYNYNQLMYRLDLADPRLKMP